jgi:hypothetical protein
MNSLPTQATILSQWYDLIKEASKASFIKLPEDVESYLVFLLMEFMKQPDIAKSVLSSEYLEALNYHFQTRQMLLKNVGDKCLLISGLFPARAQKKRIKISYFVNLGKNAYTVLGNLSTQATSAQLYATLSERFVAMMDILHTTRELDHPDIPQLNIFDAYELWNDTQSEHARKTLEIYTKLQPIKDILKHQH